MPVAGSYLYFIHQHPQVIFCRRPTIISGSQAGNELAALCFPCFIQTCINENVICKSMLNWLSCGLTCMQFGVLHFKNDVDHLVKILKQAMKIVKGMEKKKWYFSSICIGTQRQTKNFHHSPHPPPPVNILLAVNKNIAFIKLWICILISGTTQILLSAIKITF